MSKIVRGYWDCRYCETKGIDGLAEECPNCGHGREADTKFYMKSENAAATDYVSDQELENAGIRKEDCDGEHFDWVCDYCGELNHDSYTRCKSCGSDKKEATRQYGGKIIGAAPEPPIEEPPKEPEVVKPAVVESKKSTNKLVPIGILASVALIFLGLGIFLLKPIEQVWTVSDQYWNYTVNVEENTEVHNSGWTIPSGAEVYKKQNEIHHYDQVVDHYEEVEVQKSRQEISHYDTQTSYTDNGNGTFTEHTTSVPVYKTVYYTEVESQPVYKSVPIYQVKYYYTEWEWKYVDTYETSKHDKEPYYSTEYTLSDLQRDIDRSEAYTIVYDTGEEQEVSYDEYMSIDIGDKFGVTTCRLGIVYEEKAIP